MGKFDPLGKYLSQSGAETITLRFSDVERILGEELCPSARRHDAYWRLSRTHKLPMVVDEAGYRVESLSLTGETVVFRKL